MSNEHVFAHVTANVCGGFSTEIYHSNETHLKNTFLPQCENTYTAGINTKSTDVSTATCRSIMTVTTTSITSERQTEAVGARTTKTTTRTTTPRIQACGASAIKSAGSLLILYARFCDLCVFFKPFYV